MTDPRWADSHHQGATLPGSRVRIPRFEKGVAGAESSTARLRPPRQGSAALPQPPESSKARVTRSSYCGAVPNMRGKRVLRGAARSWVPLQELASLELLPQLPELGHDVDLTVVAAAVIAEIVLMVGLSGVELGIKGTTSVTIGGERRGGP